jgi:hypothetical protein
MERLIRAQDRLPQVSEQLATAPPSNVVSISF